MPIIESKSIDERFVKLDWATRYFYYELRTHLDPLGRISGNIDLLSSELFPLERGKVRRADLERWLQLLEQAGQLRCYLDSKSRPVIEVPEAKQSKMRNLVSKYESFQGGQIGLQFEQPPPAVPSSKFKVQGSKLITEEKEGREGAAHAPEENGKLKNIQHSTPNIQHPMEDGIAHGAVEVPDEKTAVSQADMRAIPADFARLCYADWLDNAGCDSMNRPKPWLTYVAKRWRYEQGDWKNGKHRGKKSVAAVSTGPILNDVLAYAREKGDGFEAAARSFYNFWSERNWQRQNGHGLDWKIELSNRIAQAPRKAAISDEQREAFVRQLAEAKKAL